MISNKFKSILVLIFTSTSIFAQDNIAPFKEWDVENYYRTLHPEWAAGMDAAKAELEEFTRNFQPQSRDNDPYIIPVVFHIVHYNGSENISMAQIDDAVRILNLDFRKLNPDTASIVEDFQDRAADCNIEFRLARYDEDGNCTNGVVRTLSSTTFIGGENLKDVSPIWDRSSYLNIWVCESIESGAAGYSNYPSNFQFQPSYDGIVILHDYVGSIGTGEPGTSRALTHEVGHWLNLAHPWGDNNNPGESCGTDFVADTPETEGWISCNLNGMTCTDGGLDNVQNYMDYSYCTNMFTEGQKTRMLAALNANTSNRNLLWTDDNLAETGVLEDPIFCAADFNATNRIVCAGSSVSFQDLSYTGATTYNWEFNGASQTTSSEQNPVIQYNTPGKYSVSYTASNGIIDLTESKTDYITVTPNVGAPLPYFEGFENIASVPSDNIFVNNYDNDNVWQISTSAAATGSKSIKLNNNTNNDGEIDEFESNTIDLSNTSDDVVLSFKYAYARKNDNNNEKLVVYASLNCGETWSQRKTITGDDLATAPNQNSSFIPQSNEWVTAEVTTISNIYLVENFRFKFLWEANGGNNIYIDDINISGPQVNGLADKTSDNLFSISPNPARGNAQIKLNPTKEQQAKIFLSDYTGRKVVDVFTGNVVGNKIYNIPLDNLAKGIYFVTVSLSDNSIAVKKLIVE